MSSCFTPYTRNKKREFQTVTLLVPQSDSNVNLYSLDLLALGINPCHHSLREAIGWAEISGLNGMKLGCFPEGEKSGDSEF